MKRAFFLALLVLEAIVAVPLYAEPGASTPGAGESSSKSSTPLTAALDVARASDYAAAEKRLSAIEGVERPTARLALARILFEQGRFEEAERALAEAAISPADKLVSTALGAEIWAAEGKVAQAIARLDPYKDAPGVGGRRVRLALGELLIRAGRRADAEPILLKFADEYGNDEIPSTDAEGLAMVGRAMHLLRHAKDANRAYNESERGERGRIETLLWRAELFIDKYDPGHAEEVLTEALHIAPNRADAKIMLARVKLEEDFDFDAAETLVREALGVNPNLAAAYAVRAGIALRDGNADKANAAITAGLAIDPNDLELFSLRAASRFLADDKAGFEAAKRDVFARNKEFSRFYGIVGEFAEWEHRYAEVVAMMKDAVSLDSKDAKGWAELGLMQTRAGDEAEGIKSLGEAFHQDKFNVRVYNTLELLYGQWIPQKYESAREGLFDVRYPKDERAILERYVPRMLGEAWATMKMHYMFAPAAPLAVEMYRERQHFSVRTSGLPNIGIQGVCFGHVVAAMSPESEPFNWGNVLWHELAHVFAIQLSNSHVPRWFTEGLSEYETMIRRPEWQRELDPELYLALKHGRLPGAVEMNAAFTHADGELDVTVAYYAASQMLAFTAERFGFQRITQALTLWGHGKTTEDVIRQAFGVTSSEYDAAFRSWEAARLSRYDGQYMFDPKDVSADDAHALVVAHPESAQAHTTYGVALFRSHKADEARAELRAALMLAPDEKDAHYALAKLAASDKNFAEEERHLAAIKSAGGDGYAVEMALSEVARGKHETAHERAALEAAHRFDPSEPDPLRGLYDIASDEKREGDAMDALRAVARIDQHDRRVWRLLLDKLVDGKQWDEAKRVGEAALYVDIGSADVHTAYARALSATGDHAAAAYELESALLCDSKPEEKAQAEKLLAQEKRWSLSH